MKNKKILVVEDETNLARLIQSMLKLFDYDVVAVAQNGEEGIKKAEELNPDLVLMDIMLEGNIDGVKAADEIHTRLGIPVVFLTGLADDKTFKRAMSTEPYGYLVKPFEQRDLHTAIEMAIHKHKSERILKLSEQWLGTVLRSIGDVVIATDVDESILFINSSAESLAGCKHDEAVGKGFGEVFNITVDGKDVSNETAIKKVIEDGVVIGLSNYYRITEDGAKEPIIGSAAPIKDDTGEITGSVLVFRDIP